MGFIKEKMLSVTVFTATAVIHGAIPAAAELVFSDIGLKVQFILLLAIGSLIYMYLNSVGTNWKERIWNIFRHSSFISAILIVILLSLIAINYIGTTEFGWYFKGSKYTLAAENILNNNVATVDELVFERENNTRLIWQDSEKFKKLFKNLLFFAVIFWDIGAISLLQLKKFSKINLISATGET